MNITEKIKSYEDACEILGLNPENQPCVDSVSEKDQKSIIAYYKLIIITRALNEGWEPDFSDHTQDKYWNWLRVDTANIIYMFTTNSATNATANFGSRLCFKNRELAEYAITQFRWFYIKYLLIN